MLWPTSIASAVHVPTRIWKHGTVLDGAVSHCPGALAIPTCQFCLARLPPPREGIPMKKICSKQAGERPRWHFWQTVGRIIQPQSSPQLFGRSLVEPTPSSPPPPHFVWFMGRMAWLRRPRVPALVAGGASAETGNCAQLPLDGRTARHSVWAAGCFYPLQVPWSHRYVQLLKGQGTSGKWLASLVIA